jgi:hypothetical protein
MFYIVFSTLINYFSQYIIIRKCMIEYEKISFTPMCYVHYGHYGVHFFCINNYFP